MMLLFSLLHSDIEAQRTIAKNARGGVYATRSRVSPFVRRMARDHWKKRVSGRVWRVVRRDRGDQRFSRPPLL
jgi:hypothetical protein